MLLGLFLGGFALLALPFLLLVLFRLVSLVLLGTRLSFIAQDMEDALEGTGFDNIARVSEMAKITRLLTIPR